MHAESHASADADKLFVLEQISDTEFRAHNLQVNHMGGVFGGTVLGQAVLAAEATAPGKAPHSLHAMFLRSGASGTPIDYTVDLTRDGASFSSRMITARQGDRVLAEAMMSLHKPETGFSHTSTWRDAPPPPSEVATLKEVADSLGDAIPPDEHEIIDNFFGTVDLRIVNAADFMARKAAQARGGIWMRCRLSSQPPAPSPYAVAAFIADLLMPAACNLMHIRSTFDTSVMKASLDHAMWFHVPHDPGGWLYYEFESPWAGGARGFNTGRMFSEDGRLLASVSQEQLLRPTPRPSAG